MFCRHNYKRPVGIITGIHSGYEGSGGTPYTKVVFFCPDCDQTVKKQLDNVHMDVPTVEKLFPVKVRPKVEPPAPDANKFHVGSCYVGILIGMLVSLFAGISLAGYLTN